MLRVLGSLSAITLDFGTNRRGANTTACTDSTTRGGDDPQTIPSPLVRALRRRLGAIMRHPARVYGAVHSSGGDTWQLTRARIEQVHLAS